MELVVRLVGHHNGVDDVDHAIRLEHVRNRDGRDSALLVLQDDVPIFLHCPELAASHRGQLGSPFSLLDRLWRE